MIVKIKCSWCGKEFEVENQKIKDDYPIKICSHCGRTVSASKKELTGKLVGRKHIHEPFKNGDIA